MIWFKQLSIFILGEQELSKEKLNQALSASPFTHCGGLDWFHQGWVPPAPHLDAPVFAQRDRYLVTLKREDKVLPPSVVKDFLDARVKDIEDKELRKVGKKERVALKEQITDDLLPRAFVRTTQLSAVFDPGNSLLMVASATASKAEGIVSAIREAVPPFPAARPRTRLAPHAAMTDWLSSGFAPDGFELDADCELRDGGEEGAVIRISRQDLTADEISHLIKAGKQVTQIGLIWNQHIRFVLTDELQLKRIQFLDVLQEEASQAGDDQESLFEATFMLMSSELGELVSSLMSALGGLENRNEKSSDDAE